MFEREPPHKPDNLRPYPCDVVINRQRFVKSEVSPYYEKHNKEYLDALEKKGIVLSKEELAKKLITDELIRKLIRELDGEERIKPDGRYYHWIYYSYRVYSGIKAYRIIWCVADDEPDVLGIMNCYRQERFDKKIV
jgi:hypothetical protein